MTFLLDWFSSLGVIFSFLQHLKILFYFPLAFIVSLEKLAIYQIVYLSKVILLCPLAAFIIFLFVLIFSSFTMMWLSCGFLFNSFYLEFFGIAEFVDWCLYLLLQIPQSLFISVLVMILSLSTTLIIHMLDILTAIPCSYPPCLCFFLWSLLTSSWMVSSDLPW